MKRDNKKSIHTFPILQTTEDTALWRRRLQTVLTLLWWICAAALLTLLAKNDFSNYTKIKENNQLLKHVVDAQLSRGYADEEWARAMDEKYLWSYPFPDSVIALCFGLFIQWIRLNPNRLLIFEDGIKISNSLFWPSRFLPFDDIKDLTVRGPSTLNALALAHVRDEVMDGYYRPCRVTVKRYEGMWFWTRPGWSVVIRMKDESKPVVITMLGMGGSDLKTMIEEVMSGKGTKLDGVENVVEMGAAEKV